MEIIRFYSTNIPKINEIVNCKIIKIENNSISVHLLDYNILGFIILSDFTNKWRIRGNKKITQINKIIYAKVDEINQTTDSTINIKLSKAYLNDDDEEVKKFQLEKESNYKVRKIIKFLNKRYNYEIEYIHENFIYPFDIKRRAKGNKKFLYDYIIENKKTFLEKFDDDKKEVISTFLKGKENNNNELTTTFQMVTFNKDGINHIKNIISDVIKKYNNKIQILYNLTTENNKILPKYIIKSSSSKITIDDHNEIINNIKKHNSKDTFIK
jgi:translation initiation factor 2 alpha subunit (eIF-2alpha)